MFCRAFTDMRMEAWIAAHVAAFEFIGEAVQILVPDNATTATHRKARATLPGSSPTVTGRWPTTIG